MEGRRAVGVEYRKAGQLHLVRAEREVLMCAGLAAIAHSC